MPGRLHVVKKDFDVEGYLLDHNYIDYKEDFWLHDGYIIVNFDIETVKDGKRHLSYINKENVKNGYCNMMINEGFQLKKTDNKGNNFNFAYGDFMLYYTDKAIMDDYTSGGTH